jgi:signal transduction histidine kinase
MTCNDIRLTDVLLAEDNPGDVLLAQEALTQTNLLERLHVVGDGEEVLAFLRKSGKHEGARRPDLILLDLGLPKKDGLEVLAEIMADPELRSIPVVIVSGSDAERDIVTSCHLGARRYVSKPINIDLFLQAVRAVHHFGSASPACCDEGKSPSRIRALLVEDNHGDVLLVKDALADASADVELGVEMSLRDALANIAKGAPDLIVLDLNLPDSQGIGTVVRTRRAAPNLPIVVLSGIDDDALGLVAVRAGAQDYLPKRNAEEDQGRLLLRSIRYAVERLRQYDAAAMSFERRVRDRASELEARSQKLAEKNQALLDAQRQREALSALVVHDLRSPASAIMCAASMELEDEQMRDKDRRRWRTVFSSAEHILRTAVNLLDIAQAEDGRLVPRLADLELGTLLMEVREILSPLSERRGQSIELSSDVPRGILRADRELVGRVMQNLVDNALRHSPSGATVRVEARVTADGVVVAVCDQGPGIPVVMRGRIFDAYVRLGAPEESPGHSGLGLWFCRLAIEAHGGSIWIEDGAPLGSRFCFRLPIRARSEGGD